MLFNLWEWSSTFLRGPAIWGLSSWDIPTVAGQCTVGQPKYIINAGFKNIWRKKIFFNFYSILSYNKDNKGVFYIKMIKISTPGVQCGKQCMILIILSLVSVPSSYHKLPQCPVCNVQGWWKSHPCW